MHLSNFGQGVADLLQAFCKASCSVALVIWPRLPGHQPLLKLWLIDAESGGVRPFGVSLLLAGYDENGPQLYQIDPSGSYFAWKASAIGKNMVNAKTFLEKRCSDDMELEDAIHIALLTLKEGFEGQISGSSIEVAIVTDDLKCKVLTAAEVSDYLAEVE